MDFETAKSVNPFLMDDVINYSGSENIVASSNPFLSSDFVREQTGSVEEQTGVDNPFLSDEFEKNYELPDTNPFASFGTDYSVSNDFQDNSIHSLQASQAYNVFSTQDYNISQSEIKSNVTEPVNETRPNDLDLITTSNINDAANDFIISSDEEITKPKRPPPPRTSMPKETQDLILSVTGALKATSDHLLDRLPPTRAPSPTAFPDFHSPSPTPDSFTDLLGNEQPNVPQATLTNFTSNDTLNILTPTGKPTPSGSSAPTPRPPPARPAPPKPAPPSFQTQPPPQPQRQEVQEDDVFDLFGTSKPPPPKTKDAILNLYSQPKPQPQDLLMGDLLIDDIPIQTGSLLDNQKSALDGGNIDLLCSQIASMPPEPDNKIKTGERIENHIITTEDTFNANTQEFSENEIPKTSLVFEKQDDNTIFSDLSVIEQNDITAKEKVMNISTQENSVQDSEEHYIFGTKPAAEESIIPNSTSFNGVSAISIPEPEIPIFGTNKPSQADLFDTEIQQDQSVAEQNNFFPSTESKPQLDAFDAFAAKFEQAESVHKTGGDLFDPFASTTNSSSATVWGTGTADESDQQGFDGEDNFDTFLSMSQPPHLSQPTPNRLAKTESTDSDNGGFNLFIKPKEGDYQQKQTFNGTTPILVPPPKSPVTNSGFNDTGPRFNPFDEGETTAFSTQEGISTPAVSQAEPYEGGFKRTDSQETPPTPLFDEDVSQPLEDFPRIHYEGEGWEMQLRHPNKKKITGQRFWKKIFVKIVYQGDNPVLQLFNLKEEKDPFLELPLQAYYAVSDISAQQYDQFGKIFTVKLQYIFYKERPGVRPGQVKKAERITNKLSQFAAYAIQGDYHGVKEFGSDLKKLGLPVEHAPQISQLLKLGSMQYEDLKQFSVTIEECLFKMSVHRDRALTYKMEEVQITVVDEIYVEQNALGHVEKQIARVRLFFLGFLSGMPDVELGLNDMWRQGKEVVGRHDIIPVVTEEWIRLEAVEFHACIQQEEYEKTRTIKFKPPDACYIELMRFRIRPPKNRELPLQLKAVMCITGNKVELRADILVPGFASRKLGQIPCEDVMIRFPIPECWIYLFRVEKHFRYGSVKSAHRRTGKIKGIERFLGAVETLEPSLMEVTSGQAKYEHQHRAIVWRMPRLPKEGQGAYTTHNLVCRMLLTSFDQIPDNLAKYAYVEFTMPATQASHTTVRSVSLCDSPSDSPPEKYVRQLARHEYRVGIEHVHSEETAPYEAAAMIKPKPETVPEITAAAESDSDSSD